MNLKTLPLLAAVGTLATACSGGAPSETDIADALKQQLKEQLEASSGVFKEEDVKINSIKNLGCNEAESKAGYLCDVDVDLVVSMPYVGEQRQQGVQSIRFVETDKGWTAVHD